MLKKKQNHVHKLRRHVYETGNKVFFCTLPDCNYKIDCALALGKTALCNRCDKEFRMDENQIRRAKPHCDECSKRRVVLDGQVRYARPSDAIMQEVAHETASDLKDRLSSLVGKAETESIEDI